MIGRAGTEAVMKNETMTLFCRARAPGVSLALSRLFEKFTLGNILPLLAAISLFGCQSSVGKTNAAAPSKTTSSSTRASRSNGPELVTIPSGTTLLVSLNTTLRTDREMSGDGIVARLYHTVVVNQMVALPAGTPVRGRLILVAEPYRTLGKAQMTLIFDQIVDPYGRIHSISTAPIVFVGECDKTGDESRSPRGGPTRLVSGAFANSKPWAGSAIVEVAASSAGGAIAVATESRQIELPANQHFVIDLEAPLHLPVTRLTASR